MKANHTVRHMVDFSVSHGSLSVDRATGKPIVQRTATNAAESFLVISSGGRRVSAFWDIALSLAAMLDASRSITWSDCRSILMSSGDDPADHARNLLRVLSDRHAYQGTLAIELLSRIRKKFGEHIWLMIRRHARANWKETIFLELADNLGRPTVPQNLLPVFALHEVEIRTGEAVKALSQAQMELLGL